MRKIPAIFRYDDSHQMTDIPNPACDWVFSGEGVATVKYDGTCVLCWWGDWYFRRTVKKGKAIPYRFVKLETDPATGITVGWEPARNSSHYKDLLEAGADGGRFNGTYELCGPNVNGNHQGYSTHILASHANSPVIGNFPRDREGIKMEIWERDWAEGVVFHHMDGRMAKIRRKDFGFPWPSII